MQVLKPTPNDPPASCSLYLLYLRLRHATEIAQESSQHGSCTGNYETIKEGKNITIIL